MSEYIVVGTEAYYKDLREMGGDPTAGMDASGDEPWRKEDEDIIRPGTEQHTQSAGEQE